MFDTQQFMMVFSIFWIFGWMAIFIVIWQLRVRGRQKRLELIHQERMLAMEKGIPLPELPELPQESTVAGTKAMWRAQATNPQWSLGIGAIFMCLGIGISLALFLSGDAYHRQVWSFGLISVFLGIGLCLHHALTKKA